MINMRHGQQIYEACPNTGKLNRVSKGDKTLGVVIIFSVITFSVVMFSVVMFSVTPTWIDGAGHNDVPLFPTFWLRLKRFIEIDLRGDSSSDGGLRISSSKTSSDKV